MKINSAKAIEFLKALRPNGPWNLVANATFGETFTEASEAREWIIAHQDCNLYYGVNPVAQPTGKAGRVKKEDVDLVEILHLDLDQDEQGPIDGDPKRKAAAAERLFDFQPRPTVVVDSGGGVQALWILNEPVERIRGENMNRWLIQQTGGDTSTWNSDRILRLPGTINYPSATKRKRGRKQQFADVINFVGGEHEAWEFDEVEGREVKAVDVQFDAPEPVPDLAALGLKDDLVQLVETGRAKQYPSRSEALLGAVSRLLYANVTPEQVLGIITDPQYGISESVLEQTSRTPEEYAERQVRRALSSKKQMVDYEGFEEEVEGIEYE